MSPKEVPRAGLLKAALARRITNDEGARAVHLSVRQFIRVKHRFQTDGAPALCHRLRGRPSPHRLPADVQARVATLPQTTTTMSMTATPPRSYARSRACSSAGPPAAASAEPWTSRPSLAAARASPAPAEPRKLAWAPSSNSTAAPVPGSKPGAPR